MESLAFLFTLSITDQHPVLLSTTLYHEMHPHTHFYEACACVRRKRRGVKNCAERSMVFSRFHDGVHQHRVFGGRKHAHGPPSTAKLVGWAVVVSVFTMATRKWHLVFSASDATFADEYPAESFSFDNVDNLVSPSSGCGLILWMR